MDRLTAKTRGDKAISELILERMEKLPGKNKAYKSSTYRLLTYLMERSLTAEASLKNQPPLKATAGEGGEGEIRTLGTV